MAHLLNGDFSEIVGEISKFFQNGSLTSSYKPILFKAILFCLKKQKYYEKNDYCYISIDNLSEFFIKVNYTLYRRFRLKQLTNKDNKVAIYRLIDNYYPNSSEIKLPKEINSKFLSDVKKLLFRNVMYLLRRDMHIYEFADENNTILNLKRDFHDEQDFKKTLKATGDSINDISYISIPLNVSNFIKIQRPELENAIIARLAIFLEGINNVPNLNRKISVAFGEYKQNRNISPEKKQLIYEFQNYRCFYCGKIIKKENNQLPHADHFIPYNFLFDSEIWNIVGACSQCNLKKSNKICEDYYLQNLIDRNNNPKFWQFMEQNRDWDPENLKEKMELTNKFLKQHYDNCRLYFKHIKMNE